MVLVQPVRVHQGLAKSVELEKANARTESAIAIPSLRRHGCRVKDDDNLEKAIRHLTRAIEDLRGQLNHTEIVSILLRMERQLQTLTMNQGELSAALDKLTAQVGKVAKEQSDRFDALTLKIKELTDIIEAGEVKPEVAAALESVQTALDTLDAAIPDAPPA